MKIVSIVGARPQFIKAAPVSTALASEKIEEQMIYTGQHYDDRMAAIFFREFDLPAPAHSLGISGGTHGQMTGRMMEAVEAVLIDESPDCVLVYGDTNSTLAGALAGAKLGIPVAHVEAGLRSYRHTMPEEINRRLTDHLSSVLFCPTETAVRNLISEGITSGSASTKCIDIEPEISFDNWPLVVNVGDVMVDALHHTLKRSPGDTTLKELESKSYALLTLHRAESTADKQILNSLLSSICDLADVMPVLFPLHPRTRKALQKAGLFDQLIGNTNIRVVEPMDHVTFIYAQQNARVVVTDSGGAQKEACILGIPCLTLRDETEWTETTQTGWNELLGCPPKDLAVKAINVVSPSQSLPNIFGDGHAAERIAAVLLHTDLRKRGVANNTTTD